MSKVIVYKNENGGVSVVHPAPKSKFTIEQIAPVVVPRGVKYGFFNASDIPSDRTFRDAWDIDEALLTHGVGSETNSMDEVVGGKHG